MDAAASADNAKVKRFFTREQDGLAQSWAGEIVWLNPPYDKKRLAAWVRNAYEESQRGATVVVLLPVRTHADWYHAYCQP